MTPALLEMYLRGGIVSFPTVALRVAFVKYGVELGLINYAVGFIDASNNYRNPAGLSFSGTCAWVQPGAAYVKDVDVLVH